MWLGAGNEYLAQMLIRQNGSAQPIQAQEDSHRRLHCYNIIKNEYSQFGAAYLVAHHSELLSDLFRQGRLKAVRLWSSRRRHGVP
jgi:hypothetical protein